jgi:hypothetical protein
MMKLNKDLNDENHKLLQDAKSAEKEIIKMNFIREILKDGYGIWNRGALLDRIIKLLK